MYLNNLDIEWILNKIVTFHNAKMINPTDLGEPLNFFIEPLADQSLHLSSKIS